MSLVACPTKEFYNNSSTKTMCAYLISKHCGYNIPMASHIHQCTQATPGDAFGHLEGMPYPKGKGQVLQINEACACTVAVKTALLQCMRSVPTALVVLGYPVSPSTHRNNHNIRKCSNGNRTAHFKTNTHLSTSRL